jgi:hypothetical protein
VIGCKRKSPRHETRVLREDSPDLVAPVGKSLLYITGDLVRARGLNLLFVSIQTVETITVIHNTGTHTTGSSIKERMLHASSRRNAITVAEQEGLKIEKKDFLLQPITGDLVRARGLNLLFVSIQTVETITVIQAYAARQLAEKCYHSC